MRLKVYLPLLFIMLVAGVQAQAQDQNETEEVAVRGVFLTSRPASGGSQSNSAGRKTSAKRTTPPSSSQSAGRKTTGKGGGQQSASKGGGTGETGGGNAKSLTSSEADGAGGKNIVSSGQTFVKKTTGAAAGANGGSGALAPLALGYTLYMRDANGDAVRVDPSREFHNGDRVRIALEPNTDSYLYVFHTENGGQPEMIFPDARLAGGDNFIEAHVPTEIPSSQEEDERLRWFAFYGQAATERLYIVVTREPLPLVPTGDALIKYCAASRTNCPWHPTPALWAQVQKELNSRVLVTKEKNYGQAQTTREREATTRGFGLDQSAPAPSVIRMNATSNAPVLVTALDLIHN